MEAARAALTAASVSCGAAPQPSPDAAPEPEEGDGETTAAPATGESEGAAQEAPEEEAKVSLPTYALALLAVLVVVVFVGGFGCAFLVLKKSRLKKQDPPTQMAFAASFTAKWVESSWNRARADGRSPGSPGEMSLSRVRSPGSAKSSSKPAA